MFDTVAEAMKNPRLQDQFNRLVSEMTRVVEYFEKNFPSCTFFCTFASNNTFKVDEQNNPPQSLSLLTRIETFQETKDKMVINHRFSLTADKLMNSDYMEWFISNVYETYTQNFTKKINEHYQEQKNG